MLWLTKSNPPPFRLSFALKGSSPWIEHCNGFAVLHCVTPLRVQSSIHGLNSSHAKAAPKATGEGAI